MSKDELAKLEALLPSTWYADRPFDLRLELLVRQWRKLHEANRKLEERIEELNLETLEEYP